jgi:hypothetical protein
MGGTKRKTPILIIQERDRKLLKELAVMRIVDREMAKVVAGFRSTTRVNTRLLKLTRGGLLNRFFVGSIAAGRKAIYTLSPKGGLLTGMDFHRISRSHGRTLVGDLFIDHQMRINEIYAAVKHLPLPEGTAFHKWQVFFEPVTASSHLIPDGYFELTTLSATRPMFLEIDLGNQSTKVWEQKTRAYLQFALSGDFPKLSRQQQFRVLVITTSPRRLASIRSTVAKQTDKIFWFSDFQTINRETLWSPIWLRPTSDQKVALL